MKRTFLVEIDDAETVTANEVSRILDRAMEEYAEVTETTTTHAKEREVISDALDLMDARVAGSDQLIEFAGDELHERVRELRALMEGNPNG